MKNRNLLLLNLGICIGTFLLNQAVFAQENPKEVTLTGTIDATAFDNTGTVIQIALSVEEQVNESDVEFVNYIIVNDNKGKELFHLIGKTVRITGKLSTDKQNNTYITVKEYKVINQPS
ncbi:MAG: hypothetical protein KDF60_14795 [Calditrichaeota bacterium]|nr:hypothetical protein [Calditrichota bacterium]